MLNILDRGSTLCDGLTRREWLRVGGLGLFGLSLPALLESRNRVQAAPTDIHVPGFGRAKSCIVLFLLGGPPQHETWDPKPNAPTEVRGDLRPIPTVVPGLQIGETMPLTARNADKICVLRGVTTQDSAHSSSGYAMTTGIAHAPRGVENARPGAPNNWPSLGAIVRHLKGDQGGLPSAITLPERLANDGNLNWPGQDGGLLGRAADPWILNCDPSAANFSVPELTLTPDVPEDRLDGRLSLLQQINQGLDDLESNASVNRYDMQSQQALGLLNAAAARRAFDLTREAESTRDRYGRTKFGQSVLLARRLVEAGVTLVQVSWPRVPGAVNNGHWDTHSQNTNGMRQLMPRLDQAYAALLEDLQDRALLDETLVVWMGEFGRTPRLNGAAGRDHWGNVFSVALAGGGVRGGYIHGSSDSQAAYPLDGRVLPHDFSATIFHALGYAPGTEMHDVERRPHPISRGDVVRQIF
jgi:hypothetical protein